MLDAASLIRKTNVGQNPGLCNNNSDDDNLSPTIHCLWDLLYWLYEHRIYMSKQETILVKFMVIFVSEVHEEVIHLENPSTSWIVAEIFVLSRRLWLDHEILEG